MGVLESEFMSDLKEAISSLTQTEADAVEGWVKSRLNEIHFAEDKDREDLYEVHNGYSRHLYTPDRALAYKALRVEMTRMSFEDFQHLDSIPRVTVLRLSPSNSLFSDDFWKREGEYYEKEFVKKFGECVSE